MDNIVLIYVPISKRKHFKSWQKDTSYTVRQLARMTSLPLARVHCILKKHLQLRKINARLIPHLLTTKRGPGWKGNLFVEKIPEIQHKGFRQFGHGDETWVHFFEPKRKCSNQILATKNARRPSIAKRIRTVRKVLYGVFFDYKGPVMQIPVPKGKLSQGSIIETLCFRNLWNAINVAAHKQVWSTSGYCITTHQLTRRAL